MALKVKKFDPNTIGEFRIVFLIGRRNTGKSVLMRDLLSHMPKPDYALAMAPTEDSLDMFRKFLPEACIFNFFSQEKLDAMVALQKRLVAKGKRRHVLLLLDDCLYQKGVLKSTAMRSVFMNGRHDGISMVCAAQYLMDIDSSLRNNIDYLFSLRENILVNRKKLFTYYFGQFPKFEDFEKVFAACTNDYRAIVLDNTVSSTFAGDSIRWYKADTNVPDFKLCREVYWKWSETLKTKDTPAQMSLTKDPVNIQDVVTVDE